MHYAKWFIRVVGNIIDTLIPVPFFILAELWVGSPGRGTLYFLLIAAGFALSAYNRWYRGGVTGQSWGRRVVGVRLVGEQTGRPVGTIKAAVRDIAHLLDSLPLYLGYLFPLWSAKRQTIADKVVRTVVVH